MLRLLGLVLSVFCGDRAAASHINLGECLSPSPVKDVAAGAVVVAGRADVPDGRPVRVRVTTAAGTSYAAVAPVAGRRFACRYPNDFPGAPPLAPQLLYVDTTAAADFGGDQAEGLLVVAGRGAGGTPDLPLAFTDDLIDAVGRKDGAAAQWLATRGLVSLFARSRVAAVMRVGRPDFDLANPADLGWFKANASLYYFDHRDRDWSRPLGNRPARSFWQAVWDTWFNPSNDHPWDGDPANRAPANYRPYTFANDLADLLVLYRLRPKRTGLMIDNRAALADEVLVNLLAMQHAGADNFALKEPSGRQEHYAAGAFRYGIFVTGEWLTEGTGWFVNPRHRDFARGGVFNGRCVWALGESLKADPDGPLAGRVRDALTRAVRYCLHDGLARGYTKRTPAGRPVWGGSAGEHGYLLLGMVAAAEVAPDLPVTLAPDRPAKPLREVCGDALDALAELPRPDGTWSRYANADAVNVAALAAGALAFPNDPRATNWTAAAKRAADAWMAFPFAPGERAAPTPHFANRREGGMSFRPAGSEPPHVPLYMGGHWLHALADLFAATGDRRYADRADALLAYYCGHNPLRVRLLNELGAVNNRVTDADRDGVEDTLHWDAYPESTAFVQIGLLHRLRAGG